MQKHYVKLNLCFRNRYAGEFPSSCALLTSINNTQPSHDVIYIHLFISEFKGGSEDEALIYYTMTLSIYYAVYLKFRRSS